MNESIEMFVKRLVKKKIIILCWFENGCFLSVCKTNDCEIGRVYYDFVDLYSPRNVLSRNHM